MNVSELFDLTQWVTRQIVLTEIPEKYRALQTVLRQNSQPNQEKQPFENQKNNLIEALRIVPLRKLTNEQVLFLNQLGIAKAVGENGINIIEDVLYKNALDVATAARKLEEIHEEMTKGIESTKQIETGLEGCVSQEEYETDNEVLIRVSFTGDATMSNVTDFKTWGILGMKHSVALLWLTMRRQRM